MEKIKVSLGKRSYNILVGDGILSSIGGILSKMDIANSCYIITNPKIKSIYGKKLQRSLSGSGFETKFCLVADTEKSKSHAVWFRVLNDLAGFDKGKGVCIIVLGGGVIGDLGGFVASTYRRGVPFVQIPTTLLAQVDSAIGGKVAIDIDCAKNLVGAFYQPKAVITDISTLKSLPSREIKNGLAEVIKYGVILEKSLFLYIEKNIAKILKLDIACLKHVISRCSKLKAEVVSADEQEKLGYRSILNFGHTIGHAIEAASSYSKSISHGEAISVGMACAFDIAVMLNIVDKKIAKRAESLIKTAGLPVNARGINPLRVITATSYDKKIIRGKRRWVLPVDIGHVIVTADVPDDIVKEVVTGRLKP